MRHFSKNLCVRPSHNLPSQNIPPFSTNLYVRTFYNLSLRPRIYPARIYPSLSEYTPFSPNIIICGPPIIYPSLTEYTPSLFNNCRRPSQNIPLPPRIYPPFVYLLKGMVSSQREPGYILGVLHIVFEKG